MASIAYVERAVEPPAVRLRLLRLEQSDQIVHDHHPDRVTETSFLE